MNAPLRPYERFLQSLPTFSAQRSHGPNWRLYEELKRDFARACPGTTPQQYEAAMQAIAKACGV